MSQLKYLKSIRDLKHN